MMARLFSGLSSLLFATAIGLGGTACVGLGSSSEHVTGDDPCGCEAQLEECEINGGADLEEGATCESSFDACAAACDGSEGGGDEGDGSEGGGDEGDGSEGGGDEGDGSEGGGDEGDGEESPPGGDCEDGTDDCHDDDSEPPICEDGTDDCQNDNHEGPICEDGTDDCLGDEPSEPCSEGDPSCDG